MPQQHYYIREHKQVSPFAVIGTILAIAALGVLGYFCFHYLLLGNRPPANDPNVQLRQPAPATEPVGEEKKRIEVIKAAKHSVVNVDTLALQRNFADLGVVERQHGTGSGFVWDKAGRIVTNFHVVRDALALTGQDTVIIHPDASVRVTLADGSQWNARLVGVVPDSDLAVLQIDAPPDKLHPITVGTSHDLEVGQDVIAIGNPFGQSLSASRGIISALDRNLQSVTDQPIKGVIQVDAALNPGNSGGPLIDRDGRLIGMNTAITSPSGGSVGIGYAIPVDTINKIVTQVIQTGKEVPQQPTLGIVGLDEKYTRQLGYKTGIMIREVRPNSPAAKAGLLPLRRGKAGQWIAGDVIVKIDGEDVNDFADLTRIMKTKKVGDAVKVTVLRGDDTQDVTVRLEGV
jgi:S1-C subfamily serine protease